MGDQPCPDCGKKSHDPVSGYCSECEGDLALYRVSAMPAEWFDGAGKPTGSREAVVSARNVGAQVGRFLGPAITIVLVQRVNG